jgi:hypothetical protein
MTDAGAFGTPTPAKNTTAITAMTALTNGTRKLIAASLSGTSKRPTKMPHTNKCICLFCNPQFLEPDEIYDLNAPEEDWEFTDWDILWLKIQGITLGVK